VPGVETSEALDILHAEEASSKPAKAEPAKSKKAAPTGARKHTKLETQWWKPPLIEAAPDSFLAGKGWKTPNTLLS